MTWYQTGDEISIKPMMTQFIDAHYFAPKYEFDTNIDAEM